MTDTNVGMEDLLNQIIWTNSIPDIVDMLISMGAAVVIVLVLFGVLQCFFGYKVFRFELGLLGATAMGVATYLGCRFLLHYTGGKLIRWTAFAAFMGAGMLFTVSAIIVFLTTLLGTTVGLMLASNANGWDMLPQVIIVIALAAALISVVFYRHVIIIGNAVFGAGIIGLLMSGLFESNFFGLIIGIVFAIFGLFTQYWMYIVGRRKQRAREEQEEARELAKNTKVLDDKIDGVDDALADLDYSKMFPSQTDLERGEIEEEARILRDKGLRPSSTAINARTVRISTPADKEAN